MKERPARDAIEVIAEEIELRESLDPHYFDELKQDSIKRALEMGIDPDVVKALFNHE